LSSQVFGHWRHKSTEEKRGAGRKGKGRRPGVGYVWGGSILAGRKPSPPPPTSGQRRGVWRRKGERDGDRWRGAEVRQAGEGSVWGCSACCLCWPLLYLYFKYFPLSWWLLPSWKHPSRSSSPYFYKGVPLSKRDWSIHSMFFLLLSFMWSVNCILVIPSFWANIHSSVNLYHVCSSVIGLPHSGWYFLVSSICLSISYIHRFKWWAVLHYVNVPHFLYPLLCWRKSYK
jgi:hypothetical protein